jgi:hypothetical protein
MPFPEPDGMKPAAAVLGCKAEPFRRIGSNRPEAVRPDFRAERFLTAGYSRTAIPPGWPIYGNKETVRWSF